jgi:arylsulfatase A-like enzyme
MRMYRNNHTKIARILSLSCCLLLTACQGEPDKPNVLLIVLDDFGYNDLAINNGSDSPTPTLDEIARQGIRFTRHYSESSCTASRVALLTGLYPARVGAHPYLNGIDHELLTLPDVLRDQGYTTHMIGKWHAGDAHRESRPEYQGFDRWFGFINQLYLRGPQVQGHYKRRRPTYRNPWLENELGELQQRDGHLTDILTNRAIEVIEQEQDPWFMYLSYYAPHDPVEPADEYAGRFTADAAGRYQALKAQLDANIERVIGTLEDADELRNTMIIVVSDNGGTAKAWPSNRPFYGSKATYTEGGVRTPLLMRWPGHWPAGEVRQQVVSIMDLYPTIVAALGLPVPAGLDGSDVFASPQERRELRWYSHGLYGDSFSMLSADGQWRLSNRLGVAEQLYHESEFVQGEPENQLEAYPDIARAMRESMQTWIRSVTRVDGLSPTGEGDWTSYSGAAFRRTPLGGTHSLGLVFRRGQGVADASVRQQLLVQDGYISVSEADSILRIAVDGNEIDVALPAGQECFSLFVQSVMLKSNKVYFRAENPSHMFVSLNGEQLVHSAYKNADLNTASPKNPLRVFSSPAGRWYLPSVEGVFLSTRALTEKEIVADIEPGLRAICDR